MIINPKTLNKAILHIDFRNELMKTLNLTTSEDKQQLSKLMLSFWFGSSNIHYKICSHPNFTIQFKDYLHVIYFCFLLLDRNISLVNNNQRLKSHLQSCQVKLFILLNNYESFPPGDPTALIQSMQFILSQLDQNDSLTLDDLLFASNTKKQCMLELQRVSENNRDHDEDINSLILSNQKQTNHYTNLLFNPIRMLNVFTNLVIAKGTDPYFHFSNSICEDSNYIISKMLLPANDNMYLEGLHVKKRGNKFKRIVLALIGHFQFEDSYLSLPEFYADLFDSDVVLINHRNFSKRAATHAENFNEIVDDVLTFAHHFKVRKKQIILYGMCGGAAHMLLAAKKLADQQIDFKLIVDRFFTRYDTLVDYKTFKRRESFKSDETKLIYSYYPFLSSILAANVIKNVIFYLLHLNIHFDEVIRSLPEENVLILQGKSHKDNTSEFPSSTDIFIHPDNDIRKATKIKRHEHKQILKELRKLSSDLIYFCTFSTTLKYAFAKLYYFFDQSIELIDNEKMKYENVTSPTDLHSTKLYSLTTRHDLPMKQFIKGFFTQGPERWVDAINKIPVGDAYTIESALYSIYDEPSASSQMIKPFSSSLESFLSLFMQQKNYLAYMGSRLFASNLGDVCIAINDLIDHPLFQALSTRNISLLTNRN